MRGFQDDEDDGGVQVMMMVGEWQDGSQGQIINAEMLFVPGFVRWWFQQMSPRRHLGSGG